MANEKNLSESAASSILSMITVEKRFQPGDRLPNETILAKQLGVSRTTLREAVRMLAANGVLEIRRGVGTFVCEGIDVTGLDSLAGLSGKVMNVRDLYEFRLIFEPEAAYLAALRGDDMEIKRILALAAEIEAQILAGEDRRESEQAFHKSIAKATHNEFMSQLMPVIYQAIEAGVELLGSKEIGQRNTISDHQLICEFLQARNPEGAKNAMKIHLLHAMEAFAE